MFKAKKGSLLVQANANKKISQLNATNTRLRSSERSSHTECKAEQEKYSAKIKSLKSLIKTLEKEATLAQKASSLDKDTILSLEAKVRELEGKSSDPKEIDSLRLELERVKDLNSKNHEIECMEKGIEVTHEMGPEQILNSKIPKLICRTCAGPYTSHPIHNVGRHRRDK